MAWLISSKFSEVSLILRGLPVGGPFFSSINSIKSPGWFLAFSMISFKITDVFRLSFQLIKSN